MGETVQADASRRAKAGALLLWCVTMVLGFVNLVMLREVGLAAIALVGATAPVAALADKIGFFLFGVCGLAIIILSEAYYRKGVEKGALARRFLTVSVWQLLAIAGCGLFLRWLPDLAEAARTPMWVIVASLVVCAIACVLRLTRRASTE